MSQLPPLDQLLDRGKWLRPSDKEAVYIEIEPGCRWGIRVTFYGQTVRVEAIEGERCSRYQAPRRLAADVHPPTFWERLRGIRLQDKLMREVALKRAVAREEEAPQESS